MNCHVQIASFPLVQWLDETVEQKWTMTKVVENSLAAGMLGFFFLDLVCQFVIPSVWKNKEWWP